MGSSRLYRHLNPMIFDNKLKQYEISTFNLAAPGTFNPEIYYLLERFIETNKNKNLKHVLVELQSLNQILRKNLKTTRNYYWHSLKSISYSIKTISCTNLELKTKIKVIAKYIISYIYKKIYSYKGVVSKKKNQNLSSIGKNKDGFYSLNDEMNDNGGSSELRERFTKFHHDREPLKQRLLFAKLAFSSKNVRQNINTPHLKKLIDLINKAKEKGAHIIYIIPLE